MLCTRFMPVIRLVRASVLGICRLTFTEARTKA
jgi:hypothetical protein